MHGFIYIILKESLKNIPIIGWGCQFYNFIFLSRKWEEDQSRFKKHLDQLNKPNDPMWLIIFPEGTNLSATTREKSKRWAEKTGLQDMKHQLLPRSTGLHFCLDQLKGTTDWLYDCTIAYEGVPDGQFGQDIFTLRSSFFEGRPPKSVNMHWRRFHLDTIPINNSKAFEVWLRNRWREKDYMLEYFHRNNRFPADDFWKEHLNMDEMSSGSRSLRSVPRPAITIETEVKSGNWNEFVKIFAPITSVMMALTVAYGASPGDLIPGGNDFFEQLMKGVLSGGEMKGLPSPEELEKMIEGAAKLGAQQSAPPQDQDKVQRLTQENLARLVKQTAIKSGMVLPGGMRRLSTALPAQTAPLQPRSTLGKPGVAKPRVIKAKSAVNVPNSAKRPSVPTAKAPAMSKPTTSNEMQTIMTKSGVAIKIPKAQIEEAKKTGTITTTNGLVLRVGKQEIEEAQKNEGGTIMTSSGIPIKITPDGPIAPQPKRHIPQQAKSSPPKPIAATSTPTRATATKAARPATRPVPAVHKATPNPNATLSTPAKRPTRPQVVTKKSLAANGGVKKPAPTPIKLQGTKPTVKKPAT
jgi:hypothetical protein